MTGYCNVSSRSGRCIGQIYFPNLQTNTRNYTEAAAGQAVFSSSTTLPAPNLRVVVRNVTLGINQNPPPYTDREYDKPPTSEEFKVNTGAEHSSKYLAVQEGKNDFFYEIKRLNTVIESGSFTATIHRRTRAIERNETPISPGNQEIACQPAFDEQNNRDFKRR